MEKMALIVAGGSGQRMESDIPKQFLKLGDLPILMHTLKVFYSFDPKIRLRVVLPEGQIETWSSLCEEYDFSIPCEVLPGGETRFLSVRNGLQGVDDGILIAIHDGVRPLVSHETLSRCYMLGESHGVAVPVAQVRESVRQYQGDDTVAVNRANYLLVQTPSVFHSEIIKDAYTLEYQESFTDDASVIEAAGYKVYTTEGNPENIKITAPIDLKIAEALMKKD